MSQLKELYKQLDEIKAKIAAEKKRLRELNANHIERVASEEDFKEWRQDRIVRPAHATRPLKMRGEK